MSSVLSCIMGKKNYFVATLLKSWIVYKWEKIWKHLGSIWSPIFNPKYDDWFFSDLQRFTQIVLKFKTCNACVLNFRKSKFVNLKNSVVVFWVHWWKNMLIWQRTTCTFWYFYGEWEEDKSFHPNTFINSLFSLLTNFNPLCMS